MQLNLWIVPTLLAAYALAFAGYAVTRRISKPIMHVVWCAVAAIAALPALSMPLYYLHLYDNWAGYYAFRALPGAELSAAAAGVSAGVLAQWATRARARSRLVHAGILMLLTLGLVVPYIKPLLAPVDPHVYQDRWSDGVCLQSTASCGAASAATMLKRFGLKATEREIASECYTYVAGTENWYLARALRKRGMEVKFSVVDPDSSPPPIPSIAGVRIGAAGHFICLLGEDEGRIVVGDPLVGRSTYTPEALFKTYHFTGFYMAVNPPQIAFTARNL